jgi:hypothetical protein
MSMTAGVGGYKGGGRAWCASKLVRRSGIAREIEDEISGSEGNVYVAAAKSKLSVRRSLVVLFLYASTFCSKEQLASGS